MSSCLIIGSSPCFTIGSTDASLCFAKIVKLLLDIAAVAGALVRVQHMG